MILEFIKHPTNASLSSYYLALEKKLMVKLREGEKRELHVLRRGELRTSCQLLQGVSYTCLQK